MIGRADIEGSKSNVAMNAWLPQAGYPCGCSTPGKVPEGTLPVRPPAGTRRPALAAGAARAVPTDGRRVRGPGPPCPALEPILFPRLRIHFADFPCLHCSIDREAVHLGDTMRL
ncbi:unnamed protein product [Prunus brigantina]